ncbi:MAG: hypothetical protein IKH96_08070 [Ruminococcus sp.]|uniref:hypothetical protein n=1 Tax=Ruminococcus sp. TaxID=41978 RepID=UPI0025D29198|nr:hypothetical protein [Ruminococcus sp.]MBR6995961.1 hypothetical protein [Ruminococcus sp.]
MLKGVNKRIVEVNDPDSLYFERAVFYLRPNVTVVPDTVSHLEAERLYTKALGGHKEGCSHKARRKKLIIIGAAAAAVLLMLMKIF